MGRTVAGKDDAGHPGALGAPEHGPDILWIGDPVQHQQEGEPTARVGWHSDSSDDSSTGRASATTPWGASVRAARSRSAGADVVDLHPSGGRQVLDLVEDVGRVHPLGQVDRR